MIPTRPSILALFLLFTALGAAQAQQADMTFFLTSAGMGKGADLGGLAGADAWCGKLAMAAGAKATQWHAYLSTQAADGAAAVNARDRIGLDASPALLSWNSSHLSRGGCGDAALASTGGAGMFYCFAVP